MVMLFAQKSAQSNTTTGYKVNREVRPFVERNYRGLPFEAQAKPFEPQGKQAQPAPDLRRALCIDDARPVANTGLTGGRKEQIFSLSSRQVHFHGIQREAYNVFREFDERSVRPPNHRERRSVPT